MPLAYVIDRPDRVIRLISVLADPIAVRPEELFESWEDRQMPNAILGKLPERWREIFLLSVVGGRSDYDIARADGTDH